MNTSVSHTGPSDAALALERSCNLDLLRTIAITTVVFFHLIQMSPVPLPGMMRFASAGKYGVDLFFVLSGWLIGNLYWREYKRFGDVQLLRFWSRRWLRTIPPYLVALALSWLAVKVERHQPFDFGYLLFLQNYYHEIPFFLVSWSLCIEEHFYLFIPLFLVIGLRLRISVFALFGSLIVTALVWRGWLSTFPMGGNFGYAHTATHLRWEGLLLGFWAANLVNLKPASWLLAKKASLWVAGVSAAILGVLVLLPEVWMYRFGLTLLAFGLCGSLVYLSESKPGMLASSRAVHWIALATYSLYLTHPLMLHVARKVASLLPFNRLLTYFPVALLLIMVAGAGFYFAVERTSIMLRDRWVPRRPRDSKTRVHSIPQQGAEVGSLQT